MTILPPTLFGSTGGHRSERDLGSKVGPESVTLSNETTIDLPVQYNEWSVAGALFPASIERLCSVLPNRLSPIHIGRHTGLVALAGIDYQDISNLNPYNEFAVMIPVREDNLGIETGTQIGDDLLAAVQFGLKSLLGADQPTSGIGNYVHYLPVTTEDAYELGVRSWGYPKEIVNISVEDDGHTRHTTVSINDDRVITLQTRLLDRETRHRTSTQSTYTEKNGTLVRTLVQSEGKFGVRPLDPRASYTLGEHPRADMIQRLGLHSRPVAQLYATDIRSSLHQGERV